MVCLTSTFIPLAIWISCCLSTFSTVFFLVFPFLVYFAYTFLLFYYLPFGVRDLSIFSFCFIPISLHLPTRIVLLFNYFSPCLLSSCLLLFSVLSFLVFLVFVFFCTYPLLFLCYASIGLTQVLYICVFPFMIFAITYLSVPDSLAALFGCFFASSVISPYPVINAPR